MYHRKRRVSFAALMIPAVAVLTIVAYVPSVAQNYSGTITGRVVDVRGGTPLSYANVVVVGTTTGAMTMEDGSFTIRNVPVGVHRIKVMMMGYKTIEKESVAVNANQVVELSFRMTETVTAETRVIDVFGIKPKIDVTASDYRQQVSEDDFKHMPLDDVMEVLAHKSGVVKTGREYHIRGGRADEVKTAIDGVPANDPLVGSAMGLGRLAFSGMEMISGGMDAEYGDAQSAVVEITTKEGGEVFAGELRYITDDFGRADKTYTNYDNVSVGFGGPTPVPGLAYYVSGDATFADGENTTVEPRSEHKSDIFEWLKARDRMSHEYNLQSKLTLRRSSFKMTGEAILQRSRFDQYYHNWNVKGYARKLLYFQRLVPAGSGRDVFVFGGVSIQNQGPWVERVGDPGQSPNPRPVTVEQVVRDPDTGQSTVIVHTTFRAVDIGGHTVVWDEYLPEAGTYRPWILFEGFQFPTSTFSDSKEDSSYVFFNSAEHTPQVDVDNIHLKMTFDHNISDDVLYSIRLSRIEFNRSNVVGDKRPEEYESAGLPTSFPDGTYREGGISDATWYTDPDHPYLVTAYDYPFYARRRSIQYLVRSDLVSKQLNGHRIKTGIQLLYNDLDNDTRYYPAQQRPNDGTIQQGLNTNIFHNFNTEGAAYVQDKWEHEGMVVNAGVRLDYFSTGNADEITISSDEVTKDVVKYKTNWSPRLGIAFPITDRDRFFFHYGRFTQWPSRASMFASQDPIGGVGALGNPNLGEQLKVSYQAGISHEFAPSLFGDFAVFYNDIFGLLSTAKVTDDSTGLQADRYINKTYASARGLEVSLEKRLTGRFGLSCTYTYSFADGVASDADFGRTAEGLTHLPTDELPLRWDQRHTFNLMLRLADRNNWGATITYQFGSGLPWTPYDRYARFQDPLLENSERLPATHRLRLQGRKRFNIYGRELTLFVEGRNLLDQDFLLPDAYRREVFPAMRVAEMDHGSYLTETGRYGGAYMLDTDGDGRNDFVPVDDPSIYEPHRQWLIGFGYEF